MHIDTYGRSLRVFKYIVVSLLLLFYNSLVIFVSHDVSRCRATTPLCHGFLSLTISQGFYRSEYITITISLYSDYCFCPSISITITPIFITITIVVSIIIAISLQLPNYSTVFTIGINNDMQYKPLSI